MTVKVAMVKLGDSALIRGRKSITLNDLIGIKEALDCDSIECELFYRDNLEDSLNADVLFVANGGTVNFGGVQSKDFVATIEIINNFNGTVIFFSNDVLDIIDNRPRKGWVRIERPVVFADPLGRVDEGKLKELEATDVIEINQSFGTGRILASLPRIEFVPTYDAVYGGRARPAMLGVLKKISEAKQLLTYRAISQKIEKSVVLKYTGLFDNADLRSLNSLGKYSFMFYERKKSYFTSRVFEQLTSNSIVLFDERYEVFKPFWNDGNTFSNDRELLMRLDEPWSMERVIEQQDSVKQFDFEAEMRKQRESLLRVCSKGSDYGI